VAGDPPRSLIADITGAHQLELIVITNRWEYCHSVWLDPQVDRVPLGVRGQQIVDCLGRAEITIPVVLPGRSRCIATVVSASFVPLLDDLLGSLYTYGCCQDTLVVVFSVGEDNECRRLAAKYGATLIPCRPKVGLGVSIKALLYSVARVVDAQGFICLDADMLVLRDLRPIFGALEACSPDSILACREGNNRGYRDLEHALTTVYGGHTADFERLLGTPNGEASYPLVVNDGLFAGNRTALLALDDVISRMPNAAAWVEERPDIRYRNQFVFNLALARLGCGVELDPTYNVQLHVQDVDVRWTGGRMEAVWNGRLARVLHFSGAGRNKYPQWRNLFARVVDPLVGDGDGDFYADFVTALRAWVGRQGTNALAWSFYGTTDAKNARVRDPSVMPLLALLHYLIRANGCIRVVEAGTARGVSTACLASAVAFREGGRVVTFDPAPHPERLALWNALPSAVTSCIEQRIEGSLEGMTAALVIGERYEAALLDSIHSGDHVWAEFQLAAQLVCAGGLILIHDVRFQHGTVEQALQRIEAAGYGVTRLWTAEAGITEDDYLGLAVIENRRQKREQQSRPSQSQDPSVTGWSEWAASLARICQGYRRPSGAYGMTTDEELCFLENYARYSYTGQGQIVDLGCWLGATTLCLARGLSDNSRHDDRRAIEAVDRFNWEDWMTPIAASLGVPKAYQAGDSFLEDVQTLLHDYETLVQIRQADLSRRLKFPSRVEFLFIDAMKSWDLARAIPRTFFPQLIPGVSLVVQQDFGYHDPIVATNHLLMWQLREHFKCVYCIPRSCSVVFIHTKQISLSDLSDLVPEAFTPEMIDEAWEHSLRSVVGEMRPAVLVCKLLFLLGRAEMQAAEAAAKRLIAEDASVSSCGISAAQALIARQQALAAPNSAAAQGLSKIADLVLLLDRQRVP
jgi:predicted O-methyltransferase YrrM